MHINALDEALALPTREAAVLALRTQQILAYETGTPSVIDPLGGSYYIETLTGELEASAREGGDEVDTVAKQARQANNMMMTMITYAADVMADKQ